MARLLGVDGISDFDGLHSRRFDMEVQLYAFDALMVDGEDLRQLPLSMRKTNLARYWPAGRRASSWRRSNRAKLVWICLGKPASSSSRG